MEKKSNNRNEENIRKVRGRNLNYSVSKQSQRCQKEKMREFSLTPIKGYKFQSDVLPQCFTFKTVFSEHPKALFPRSPIIYPVNDEKQGKYYNLFLMHSTNPQQEMRKSNIRFDKSKKYYINQMKDKLQVIPPSHPIFCEICSIKLCYNQSHNQQQTLKCDKQYQLHSKNKLHRFYCQQNKANEWIHQLAKQYNVKRRQLANEKQVMKRRKNEVTDT